MFQQDGGGCLCVCAPLSKSHHDSVQRVVGWTLALEAKTLTYGRMMH